MLVKVFQGLGKLLKNIRELIDDEGERDNISDGLANEYEAIIQELENLGRRGERQQGGDDNLRNELIARAEALEEAAHDRGLRQFPLQKAELLDQAISLRDEAALLDVKAIYNFSDLLTPEEFKEFAELIANGKDAVQDRKALKEILDTVVNFIVLAGRVASKL